MTGLLHTLAYESISIFAWISYFFISHNIFRPNFLRYSKKLVICAMLLACSGTLIDAFNINQFTSIIQSVLACLCFIFIKKIRVLPSVIVTVLIFTECALMEFVMSLIINGFNYDNALAYMNGDDFLAGIMVSTTNIILGLLIAKYRFRFTFLSSWRPVKLTSDSSTSFFVFCALLLMSATIILKYFPHKVYIISSSFSLIALIGCFIFAIKKEFSDSNNDIV